MSAAILDGADDPTVVELKPRPRRPSRRIVVVVGAALAAAVAGVMALRAPPASVATDNAYLKSDRTAVAPRVKGLVAEVLVADNQKVVAGQPLIRLDPEEYAARVAGAQGDLALADAQVAAAQAALGRWEAERHLAGASVRQAETDIRATDAQSIRAQSDWKRFETLMGDGTVTRRDAERVRADAASAAAAADRSRAAYAVSQDQAAVTGRRQAELAAALQAAQAQRAKAQAILDLARQDADHAVIRAPISGVVGDRQANPGDYVQPGTRLLTLVPLDTLYVTANFKETQTERMLQGQPATVKVDALPGVTLKAHVQSFAPGSGSEFALLPFEPGSGNFTKIVQRVPVKLVFDAGQPQVSRLRPGLSAKVSVKLKAS
ncbi:MAG TPA: HlyD family secretion protein [Phenylobacterium sp.]|nr:HlyD family secretion protein [Phenylobacterium sp.]